MCFPCFLLDASFLLLLILFHISYQSIGTAFKTSLTRTNPVSIDFFSKRTLTHQIASSFILMNTLAMKNLNRTHTNSMNRRKDLFSFGMFDALDQSRIMKPKPPFVNRKLYSSPSIIYCPFTL